MPIKETLTASPVSLGEVLGNGKRYVVPAFQRDYAWGEVEWGELWADIMALNGNDGDHYLGALVLQATPERGAYLIIDGQQRLVSLSLLALAVIARIRKLADDNHEKESNHERERLLRERFVSTKDAGSLQHRPRLKLNKGGDGFFQNYLAQGKRPENVGSLKGSAAALYDGFRFFEAELLSHLGSSASGTALADFLETVVATRLQFIEIQVSNDETAFAVFETLNARGVALGPADLLKNFLFSNAAKGGDSDLEQAQLLWSDVVDVVPLAKLGSLLFHRLASVVVDLREKRVFAEVKRIVPAKQSVFDFLRDLKESAELYSALDDGDDEFWTEFSECRSHVRVLAMLGTQQARSVILPAFHLFAERPKKLERLLRHLVAINVRCSVVGSNSGPRQRAYQAAALGISEGKLRSPAAIARELASIAPSDDEFRKTFEILTVDPSGIRKKWLRHVLTELEVASGGSRIDRDGSDASIEHILPANPNQQWDAFSSDERQRLKARIGNLTLLEPALNRNLGSADFATKRVSYAQSRFLITRSIDADEWTPDTVRLRQERLAELAVNIWSVTVEEDV
jgi:hypothetical protein